MSADEIKLGRIPSAQEIVTKTAEVCGVTESELLGHDRCHDFLCARQVAACSMRLIRRMSYTDIQERLNRMSHATARDMVVRNKRHELFPFALRTMRAWAASMGLDVSDEEWDRLLSGEGVRDQRKEADRG